MLGSFFRETVRRRGDSTAIEDGNAVLTYGELAARLDALTAALIERFRIGRGDRVAVSLPNCWHFAPLFLSVAELGGVFVPISPNWRSGELRWCAETIRPSAVVAVDEQAACWKEIGYPAERIATPELIATLSAPARSGPRPAPPPSPAPYDHVLYLLTSGSTGFPKIVPRSHRNLAAGARNVDSALGGIERKCFLGIVPFHHANGFANSLLLPLLCGGSVRVVPQFLPRPFLDALKQSRSDVLIGSPFIFRSLADSAGPGHDLGCLDLCLSSGAPIPADLVRAWRERFGLRVRQLYGSSETGTVSIERADAPADRVTAGQPVPSVEVRIDSGKEGGVDCGGEILVRSPAAMTGYLHGSEIDVDPFMDGFFRTGDLGRFDEEGNIVILGRRKRVINLKGIKVDPVEIENLIREIPDVADCLVISAGREGEGELIKAVISVREGCVVTRPEVIGHCRGRLAEYKVPRIIEITERTPDGILGKRSVY